ncbi:zinc finger protein DZIP1L [Silurus asotus]|uniref:Zinc finger protein DZIP1L n=1 Tax=Silurus asotus TaxID=30991 RepID=A0AAD5B6L0_SILAS|nr:zinc finger protein DZIP1L [Silurus asotus]
MPSSPTSPSWSSSIPIQPFHFRLRAELIDWRRMAALDVDRVERETNISVLQEFISAVTFCAVEGERCPQCRCPTDTTLLKVLRMSQLSTEYLLHCQDYLSSQVAALEERLQGALSQALREEEEQARLEKELQEVRLESRRRKKLIATQQLLLQSSANNYHKKMQVEQMKDGLDELKEKLRLTQIRLDADREADASRRQQKLEELESRERNMSNPGDEDEIEKERRRIRERELKEQMILMGTKGISTQTLRSLIYERGQTFQSQPHLHVLRNNFEVQINQRVREMQKNKGSTPPFSSEEDEDDESGEDSAYITSSRDRPSTSVHLTPTKEQQKAGHNLNWSDSDDSDESDTQKPKQAFSKHGSVVQTLTKSLEKQLSSSITNPVGGIRVLPPASQPSPRPSFIKQQAVSEEESDLDLSSIEELTAPPTAGHRSSDVGVTSGTSVWSSAASRAGAW